MCAVPADQQWHHAASSNRAPKSDYACCTCRPKKAPCITSQLSFREMFACAAPAQRPRWAPCSHHAASGDRALRQCVYVRHLQTNMGTAELKAEFGSKKHELSVSTQQMCILLLFNGADRLSYNEVRSQHACILMLSNHADRLSYILLLSNLLID
eukprot:1159145-Pelagomonas_calceolata.AAC.6